MASNVFTPATAAALDGPEWLKRLRIEAAERFSSLSLPTGAEEIWRYSRISDLDLDSYSPTVRSGDGSSDAALPGALASLVAAVGEHAACVVVRNGRVSSVTSDPRATGAGLVVGDAAALDDGADLIGDDPDDPFVELNRAFLGAAVVVRVPAGVVLDKPVLVLHWVDVEQLAVFPHTLVRCGVDSEATVVEHYASADVSAFVDPVVRLEVGDSARLRYLNVQDLGRSVFQVGYQSSTVGRDASLHSTAVALGGDYARLRTDSRIEGKGGSTRLDAAYLADGRRMHDFRTVQDHAAPASTSDLLFKGAVKDRARSVYSGLIHVGKDAPGTSAFQTNRNLVLSEGAAAESVPNLEIETDDVRCSHASAVGPLDEEQLYYLESRGIPPATAERLIVLGFLGEVLDRLPAAALRPGLRQAFAARLAPPPEEPA